MSNSIKHLGMKMFELHLIGCSLLSVVIAIQTSSCGFVRLKSAKSRT